MASFYHLFEDTKPRVESPAKLFAKLKAKVQREAMCAQEGKHGVGVNQTKSVWMTEELKENQKFGSHRNEMQALTFSPISSPQKPVGCSYSDSRPLEEVPPGYTRRERAFLESTAVPHGLFLSNQIYQEPPQIRDLGGFKVSSRTRMQMQPVESGRGVFDEDSAPLNKPLSPNVFSPMRKKLRKRKWEQQEFTSSTEEVSNEDISLPQVRKTFAVGEDAAPSHTNNNSCRKNLCDVRGFTAARSEMIREPMFPALSGVARCNVILERVPNSPAKMFAYMKERESKRKPQKVSSSTRDLMDKSHFHQSRDAPLSTAHDVGEMEDPTLRNAPESVVSERVDSSDSHSDGDPSEDVVIPAVPPPPPVLLEDPLLLNSPQISIPKTSNAVFKRSNWHKQTKFPSESVTHLKRWFLRKSHKGLFVDGIHREQNIPWNSNIVVDRVSNSVLKTVSGKVYILVGKMRMDFDSAFPRWFLKRFANGFPADWKELYEKFLSESRDDQSRRRERKGAAAKTKSDASSVNYSVTRHTQNTLTTPDSCPPASSSSCKVSRSGRMIKPPLEYWKGGRVILDAYMNVTIMECYDTSISNPEVNTTVSARASQKPILVCPPRGEGRKQSGSASDKVASVPLRRVKASLRERNREDKKKADEKPSHSLKPPMGSSSEERPGRTTRSSRRCPATERELYVDTVPQKQSKPEKSSTQRSEKPTHNTNRPSVRISRMVKSSPESPTVNEKTLERLSSDDEFTVKRKRREKGVYSKKGRKGHSKLQLSHVSPSEESQYGLRRRTGEATNNDEAQTKHKPSKFRKTSPPTNPRPKSTQSRKKHKENKGNAVTLREQDEDEWSEAELMKLQEAVSYYPKHMPGYWGKVARMVGTRSAEECHNQQTSQGTSRTPSKEAKKPKKGKVEAPQVPVTDHPVISARAGTFKRKQQVRQFLETMPREDVDDVFSSAYMQSKRFEIPSLCLSDDHNVTMSSLDPETPKSTRCLEVKTPQCLHITPGMMGTPDRNYDDKYVYQLQKRMKKNQFDVCKHPPSKSFTPTPSVKRTMRKRGNTENDTFVVREMFPGEEGLLSESGEEEDFYFSDND